MTALEAIHGDITTQDVDAIVNAATSRLLRRALEWPFERIVVAHGEAIESGARARLRRAFAAYLD